MNEGKATRSHNEIDTSEERNKEDTENSEEVNGSEKQTDGSDHIPEFTKQDLQAAIDSLKRGKSEDSNGITAQDMKESDDETKEMM